MHWPCAGVQPLLGYCVGAKLKQRYRKCLRFSLVFAFVLSAVLTVLCYVFTAQIVGVFLTDQSAYDYAFEFARILLSTSFLFGLFYVLLNALQSMGASTASLIVNLTPGAYLHTRPVRIAGGAWHDGPIVGTAGGRCALACAGHLSVQAGFEETVGR